MTAHWRLRAVSVIGLVAACNGVREPRAPAVLQVIITPASASVVLGGTQQFTASATLDDGSTQNDPDVTWSATGGSITAGGLYMAGGAVGGFRVVAIDRGGVLADTSEVTLAPAGVLSYATSFPLTENPISEGGRWINGTVGLDWTHVSTTPGLAIGHQVGASYTDATALLTGTWGPDQAATATVYTVNQNDGCFQEVELRLRSALAPHVSTGYEIGFKASQTTSAYLNIVRWNGPLGDFTYLFKQSGAQYGITTGDVVSATVVGNVITAYKNGMQMAQVTDATYASGTPGMGFNLKNAPAGCAGTNGDYGFTSYSATDGATGASLSAGAGDRVPRRPD
jgi:hypothetical protein